MIFNWFDFNKTYIDNSGGDLLKYLSCINIRIIIIIISLFIIIIIIIIIVIIVIIIFIITTVN